MKYNSCTLKTYWQRSQGRRKWNEKKTVGNVNKNVSFAIHNLINTIFFCVSSAYLFRLTSVVRPLARHLSNAYILQRSWIGWIFHSLPMAAYIAYVHIEIPKTMPHRFESAYSESNNHRWKLCVSIIGFDSHIGNWIDTNWGEKANWIPHLTAN